MSTINELGNHVGRAVAVAAAGVGLVADYVVSGLTVEAVSNAAVKASGSAEVADYFTVWTVFVATAPLCLALIISVALLVEFQPWHYGHLLAITIIWYVAGGISQGAADPADVYAGTSAAPAATGNPYLNLGRLISWTAEPYGPILAFQGLIVGGVAAAAYYLWRERVRQGAPS